MLVEGNPALSTLAGELLELFPDAALIVSRDGHMMRANRHAHALLASRFRVAQADTAWTLLLASLRLPAGNGLPDWLNEFERIADTDGASLSVAADPGQRFRFHARRWSDEDGAARGWCVRIVEENACSVTDWEKLRLLAHDLRAPQSSTLALLSLQEEADTAVSQDEFLGRIRMACTKTLRLTDGYMELARAESQPIDRVETDFARIVMDAVDETWEAAQASRVYLVADMPDGAFPVLGDHALLVRALAHLLSNAVRHSPPGSRVECSLTSTVIAGVSYFRCAVTDHGSGIPDADQARLFQSFSRVGHAQEMLAEPGAGLGLAFVRTVACRHGGFADVASTFGAGASFGLALPMHSAS